MKSVEYDIYIISSTFNFESAVLLCGPMLRAVTLNLSRFVAIF